MHVTDDFDFSEECPPEYVVVYGIREEGTEEYDCFLEPDEFWERVRGFVGDPKPPVCRAAEITVLSMPKAKWDRYKDTAEGRVTETIGEERG